MNHFEKYICTCDQCEMQRIKRWEKINDILIVAILILAPIGFVYGHTVLLNQHRQAELSACGLSPCHEYGKLFPATPEEQREQWEIKYWEYYVPLFHVPKEVERQ